MNRMLSQALLSFVLRQSVKGFLCLHFLIDLYKHDPLSKRGLRGSGLPHRGTADGAVFGVGERQISFRRKAADEEQKAREALPRRRIHSVFSRLFFLFDLFLTLIHSSEALMV